jgi:hypothetical protein
VRFRTVQLPPDSNERARLVLYASRHMGAPVLVRRFALQRSGAVVELFAGSAVTVGKITPAPGHHAAARRLARFVRRLSTRTR